MKNKKIKALIGLFCALSMALGVGRALSVSKVNRPVEIVLADDEDDSETPTSSNDEGTDSEEPAAPASNEDQPATEPAGTTNEESTQESSGGFSVSGEDILKIIFKAFWDAIKDLIQHIKKWLKL